MWQAIPGVAGKRSHLLLSRKGPAVLGGCAVPNTLYLPPTDPEPTSSLTTMSENPDKPWKGSPGNSETQDLRATPENTMLGYAQVRPLSAQAALPSS